MSPHWSRTVISCSTTNHCFVQAALECLTYFFTKADVLTVSSLIPGDLGETSCFRGDLKKASNATDASKVSYAFDEHFSTKAEECARQRSVMDDVKCVSRPLWAVERCAATLPHL